MLEGQVLRSAGAFQMACAFPRKNQNAPFPAAAAASATTPEKVAQVFASEEPSPSLSNADAGAVIFLFPPKDRMSWSVSQILLSCKLWLLDMLNPARDDGANDKVDRPLSHRIISYPNQLLSSALPSSLAHMKPAYYPYKQNTHARDCGTSRLSLCIRRCNHAASAGA